VTANQPTHQAPWKAQNVVETLAYVKRFTGQTLLMKIGGAALTDPALVKALCSDLALIRHAGVKVVLVHGGGPSINQELMLRGLTWEFIGGQRATTPEMMDIVEMVLCGGVNRKIVRTLNAAGVLAAGVSGSDARLLQCKQASPKLGQVGAIEAVNPAVIQQYLATQREPGQGMIPVIAPVGSGKSGQAFNVNADWAAAHIAVALGIQKVIYLTDQDGILDGAGKIVSELDAGELEQLIESGVVKGGMLAKAQTMLFALKSSVQELHVLNARREHCLIDELFTNAGVGTLCRKRQRVSRASKNPVLTPEVQSHG